METDDRIRRVFEHWAKSKGYNCEYIGGRYAKSVVRCMWDAWCTQADEVADLHAALARTTARNARLINQCRDHDTRRAAAVAQCAAMAEEIQRLNETITALTRESRDAQEM